MPLRTERCDLEKAGESCKLGGACTKNNDRNPCQIFRAREPSPAVKAGLKRFKKIGKKGEK